MNKNKVQFSQYCAYARGFGLSPRGVCNDPKALIFEGLGVSAVPRAGDLTPTGLLPYEQTPKHSHVLPCKAPNTNTPDDNTI